MTKHPFALFVVCLSGFALSGAALAGPADVSKSSVVPVEQDDTAFRKGALDLQITSGVLFSVQPPSLFRPNLDYDLGVVRVGYMFDNPYGHGVFRGNDEFLLEAAGGSVFHGPGSGLGGIGIIYRRNFLFSGVQSWLVPYLEGGGGGIYSDAYHSPVQHVLGAQFEFDLQGGLGLRFRLTRKWSLDAEANFRHLSNADLASRNYGANNLGVLIGLSRSF